MQVYGIEIPTRCFIGGLPYSVSQFPTPDNHLLGSIPCMMVITQMTELELNTFFSQFGAVKDSKIITDRNGVSKG